MNKHTQILSSSHRDRLALEQRRKKAANLFAQGLSQSEVARKLEVSREASRKWHDVWKQKGSIGLKSAGKPGPKPQLTPQKLKKVEKALLKGPVAQGFTTQIWTLSRIAAMIKKVAGVKYGTTRVWQILAVMNWTCQKPKSRPSERDEKAIHYWLKTTWPRIKKKRTKLAQI